MTDFLPNLPLRLASADAQGEMSHVPLSVSRLSVSSIATALDAAWQHHSAGQFQPAQAICQQVLAQDPQNVRALRLLGLLAMHARRFDIAVDLFRRAVTVKPDFAQG